MNELILKITGEVKQSNFPAFKTEALAMIKSADKPLVSDNDFAEAEKTVKDFKAAEDAIKNAKAESLKEVADINKLFESLDEVSEALRTTRLSLNKKVVKEKAERKQQIVDAGCEKIKNAIDAVAVTVPEIHNATHVKRSLFEAAISGKRNIESMEEAVEAVFKVEDSLLIDLQILLLDNKRLIADCDFPSLFPDAAQVVCKPSPEVQSIIEGRVAKHQLAEKERKEKADAAAKAEEERKAKAAEDKANEEKENPAPQKPPTKEPAVKSHAHSTNANKPKDDPTPGQESKENYIMTVTMYCTATEAKAKAKEIYSLDIVGNVKLNNG